MQHAIKGTLNACDTAILATLLRIDQKHGPISNREQLDNQYLFVDSVRIDRLEALLGEASYDAYNMLYHYYL
jgi:hypothetical protein